MPPRRPKGKKKFITEQPRKDVVFRRALAEMGDADLRLALEHASTDDHRAAEMLRHMADPAQNFKSLPRIAQMSGFTRRELVMLYQEHQQDVLRVKLARDLPRLADDLNEDARSVTNTCRTCKGAGVVIAAPVTDPLVDAIEEKCLDCSGRGTFRVPGQTEARKSILAITGLVKPGTGFGVNINMGNAGQADSFDSLISRANDIMDDKRVVSTNVVSTTATTEAMPDENT